MADPQTIGELYEAKAITKADLIKAVDAYMANPKVTEFVTTNGLTLDLAAAVQANAHAQQVLNDPEVNMMRRRGAIRMAILLALPIEI